MFKRTQICTGVLVALAGVLATDPGWAQTERIEITGSLIRRIDGESSLPTVQLRLDDLQRSGATNAETVVTFITQQQGGTVTSGSVSGTNGAASYANLRSLGAGRTLVLLNGRRVVNNPFASAAVDLNTLPMAAVERIDTLPDGASAIYGTDAISGVINFVTRRSFTGVSIDASTQIPEGGGGEVYTAGLLAGFGNLANQGWNVYIGLNYRDQKPMFGTERDFMQTSYIPSRGFNGTSPTTFPANYTQGTTVTANPSLATGCQPPTSIAVPEANGTTIRCFADTQQFTQVVPIQQQWGAFIKGSLAITPDHTASFEYFKTQNMVRSLIAPSPEGGLTMTPLSPFYPGNGTTPANAALDPTLPISVSWRTTVLGSRSGEQVNDTQRAVAGIEGTVLDWDYAGSLVWSNSTVTNTFLNGYPMTNPLRRGVEGCAVALVANACPAGQALTFNGAPVYLNPFGPQTAAGLAYMQANTVLGQVQEGEGTLQSAQVSASRALFSLPGGKATLGLAAELRKEDMVYRTDIALVSQAASSGLAGSGAIREGERDVTAFGAELVLPIVKGLETTLSVRSDRYSDFGTATNPKIAIKFQPMDMLLLRGSYNEGFSAPALTDLYAPNATTFTGNRYNDPVLCPGGVVNPVGGVSSRDCGIQFQRLTGGNTGLKAEKSKAWTVGLVVQPLQSVTVSVDYWWYHVKDSISTVGDASIFADPVKYAGFYVRCSAAPADRRAAIGACQIPGGDPLAYVLDTNQNLGDVKTDGWDVSITWRGAATPIGRFGASLNGSYVKSYAFQIEPGGPWFNPLGRWASQFVTAGTSGGAVLRYQQTTAFTWETSEWSTRLANRYKTGYRDQNSQGAPFNVAPFNTNTVEKSILWDLSVQYRGIKGLTVSAGVINLLDEDPPFTNQTARFQARGYDDRYADPRGRMWQLGARYEF
jgi:iron complex outermembrane receptor protein